jgi:amino acid adenylation domain-containing protein
MSTVNTNRTVATNRTLAANRTVAGMLLPERIADHAARCPDTPAVIADGHTWSYGQLVDCAAQVAAALRERGAGPDRMVGLACPRSVDGLIGMLGIAFAGAAYAYLDPTWPVRHLRRVVDQCQIRVILTDDPAIGSDLGVTPLVLDDLLGLGWAGNPPALSTAPGDLAYVVYTSGSTGTRKGVAVEHGGLANTATALADLLAVAPGVHVAQFSAWSWDACAAEIWTTLAAGATLVLVPEPLRAGGPDLAAFLAAERVRVATLTPALLRTLPDADLPGLHTVVAVGEPCPADLVDRWATGGRHVFNGYGLTETTVAVSVGRCHPGQPVTIGPPLPGVLVRVVDEHDAPVPAGQPGHLLVGGRGLARGYLTHPCPEQPGTPQVDPGPPFFTDETGTRWYRTGDIVTQHDDGSLRFVQRADSQLQVRGQRIEPAEITTVLKADPRVHQCAITTVGGQLVAYVSADPPVTAAAMAHVLAEHLPPPLLPVVHLVEAWPETLDGRTDLQALAETTRTTAGSTEAAAEATDDPVRADPVLAETLGIVRAVLGRQDIGPDDDFFAVGGHSLLAAELSMRLGARFGTSVPLREVIDHPTPRALATVVALVPAGR